MHKKNFISVFNNQHFSEEKLKESYPFFLDEYITNYSSEIFLTRDLGITRKELYYWYNDGLSPYKLDTSGWKRYSLIDCIWWRFIAKLKRFGTSTKRLIEIRNIFFPQSKSAIEEFIQLLSQVPHITKSQKDLIAKLKIGLSQTDNTEYTDFVNQTGFSLFGLYVMISSMLHKNILVIETEDEELSLVDTGIIQSDEHFNNVQNMFMELSDKNYITINLSGLVYDFFNTEQIRIDNNFFSSLMNKQERKIVEMIRSGEYKQVSIIIKDGSITHFKTTKNEKQLEDTINKMSRLIKKGEYKRIELLAVDGKIVKYDEEELIKIF